MNRPGGTSDWPDARVVVMVGSEAMRDRLTARLSGRVKTSVAAAGDPGLAGADIDGPKTVVFADLAEAKQLLDRPKAAEVQSPAASAQAVRLVLVTDDIPNEDCFDLVVRHRIGCVCHPSYLEEDRALKTVLAAGRAEPPAPSLGAYCSASGGVKRATIDEHHSRRKVMESICAEVAASPFSNYRDSEHRLALEEIVNNAIFHAFTTDGKPRYSSDLRPRLQGDDRVTIDYCADATRFAFSVTDNAGTFREQTVREHIHRQLRGQGLLESGGRGLFLTFSLANGFIVRVAPGRLSQVVVIFRSDLEPERKLFLTSSA